MMKPEEQRICIGEFCGWAWHGPEGKALADSPCWTNGKSFFKSLPDYPNDLNAMHDAEMLLDDLKHGGSLFKYDEYAYLLSTLFGRSIRATAPQRAEALLRTIGKWKD